MSRKNFAVPVKLWALLCAIIGISLTANPILNCVLTLTGFFYLVFQKNIRFLRSCLVFYGVLAFLLYLIRFQGFHMVLFSEFYVLMFWNMFPVFLVGWDLLTTPPGELAAFLSKIRMPAPFILGLLVMFRFFPTMRGELKSVWQSMRNRGLTMPAQILQHPLISCEYIVVPCLLRCMQIADQLSVSAAARGAECPGSRGSYYEKRFDAADVVFVILWTAVTGIFLLAGEIRL